MLPPELRVLALRGQVVDEHSDKHHDRAAHKIGEEQEHPVPSLHLSVAASIDERGGSSRRVDAASDCHGRDRERGCDGDHELHPAL